MSFTKFRILMSYTGRFVPSTFTPSRAPIGLHRFIPQFLKNPIETLPAQVFEQPAFKAIIMGREVLFVCDPDAVQTILQDKEGLYPKGEAYHITLGAALGRGLFTSDGDQWRWQRRALASAFRPRNIKPLVHHMVRAAQGTIDKWARQPRDIPVDVAHSMMQTTFQIILDTMLSGGQHFDAPSFEGFMGRYIRGVPWAFGLYLFGLPRWMPHPGRKGMRDAAALLRRSITGVVRERRADNRECDRNGDLIDLLLAAQDPQTGRRMRDSEIVDNIATFLAAGHETTAQTLAWTLYLIASHKPVETRVRAEIETVIGDGPVTPEALDELVFCTRVLNESMRLYPPAPIITREPMQNVTWFERRVKAGSLIEIPIYAIHRHRDLWDDPDAFDPDRFAADREETRHRFSYLPFGGGPRVCIGATFARLEALAVLASVMRRVRLRPDPAHEVWPEAFITLRPRGGLPMFVDVDRG